MREQLIGMLIVNNLIVLCITIVYIYFQSKKKSVARDLIKINDVKVSNLVDKGVGIAVALMIIFLSIPSLLDMSYLRKNELCIISGVAEDNCPERNRGTRQVRVRSTQGETIRIQVYGECDDIFRGDELTIHYLPFTHYGCVVEHIEKE